MLSPSEQADACAAGLVECWRTQAAYVDGGEVAEHDGLVAVATNLPDETLHCALAVREPDDPAGAVAWATEWFHSRGTTSGVEVRTALHPRLTAALVSRGYLRVVRRPAMALHPLVPTAVPAARGVCVSAVDSEADAAAYRTIQGDAFRMTPAVAEGFLPLAATRLPGIRWLLARHEGVACATAGVSISRYGAGIVGVATLPSYRRRGIARAVTAAAVAWASQQGAELAWLYPTEMARGLYEALGFVALDEHSVWILRR